MNGLTSPHELSGEGLLSGTTTTAQVSRTLEYTPEERALIFRVGIYVKLRWLVIPGIIAATLVASLGFDIVFPTLPVYVIAGLLTAYNLILMRWTARLRTEKAGEVVRKAELSANIQIISDLVILTVLLHFTGGMENPFIFLYPVHTIAAGIVLPKRRAYELATLAMIMITILIFLEYANIVPHVNLAGFVLPYRYEQLSRVLGTLIALGSLVYGSTYVTSAVAGELRRRQVETVRLRDQLLEKRTQELEETTSEIAKLEDERRRFVRFLAIVAHDLQAPLVATQSILSYILDGYTGDITEGQKDLLERGVRRIDGLLTLISDLLDIPRIETGQIKREWRDIVLNDVMKRSLEGLESLAQQKGLLLRMELPETSPRVRGSARRLQQVITNLVNNAISYTHEGNILVRMIDGQDKVQVQVIDSGIGIPPDDLSRLFEDFFRGSNVEVKGTGLGLSISRRIVEAHGGSIWAESPDPESNKGTRFTFTLPKNPSSEGEQTIKEVSHDAEAQSPGGG